MSAGSLGDGWARHAVATLSLSHPSSQFPDLPNSAVMPQPSESDFQEGVNSGPSQPNQSSHGGGLQQFITGRAEELLISAF